MQISFLSYILSLSPKYIQYAYHREYYYIHTQPVYLVELAHIFNLHINYQTKAAMDLVAVDYPANQDRFQIVYNLLSVAYALRVMIKLNNNEVNSIPSLVFKYPSMCWYEREAWDLFGVHFINNSDLRRILTDYGFSGHPMRKDFPVTGYTEVAFSERRKNVVYKPISLVQDLRIFETLMPWNYYWHHEIPR